MVVCGCLCVRNCANFWICISEFVNHERRYRGCLDLGFLHSGLLDFECMGLSFLQLRFLDVEFID